jgi:hypothetical protein
MALVKSPSLHLFAAASVLLSSGSLSAAVVSPIYFNDFDGETIATTPADFAASNVHSYRVRADAAPETDKALRAWLQTSTTSFGWVEVPGAQRQDFTLSATARADQLEAGTGGNLIFSLVAAGVGNGTNVSSWGYRLNLNYTTGVLSLSKNTTGVTFTTTTGAASISTSIGTLYHLTLSADYTSSNVALVTVTASDGVNTFTGTYQDNAAPSGTYYGLRMQRSETNGEFGVLVDDFSLETTAVPEPAAPLLAVLPLLGLVARRKRRA